MYPYLDQCRGQGETGQSTNPASAATDARCRCTIQYHPSRNTGANLEAVGTVPVAVNLAPIPLVEQGLHGKITVCTPYRTPKVIESTGILEPITREGQFPTIR
ncbi:Uncharacterized protein LW94_10473 [Fusarium fujikuroi]|nr:Uncharacterized protein Y057_8681 [Fusarium fujikuroi]KLO90497.1 Uncharacterized protein LW93_5962 [Fusarium fujikuroi]KLP14781.1 Uncharacterized protein LW94_10473 [Fusarium fujikuroi]